MKSRIALLGILALVALSALCAYPISAKEKSEPVKVYTASQDVYDVYIGKIVNQNKYFLASGFRISYVSEAQNDPYQVRSGRWIRANNIDVKTEDQRLFSWSRSSQ